VEMSEPFEMTKQEIWAISEGDDLWGIINGDFAGGKAARVIAVLNHCEGFPLAQVEAVSMEDLVLALCAMRIVFPDHQYLNQNAKDVLKSVDKMLAKVSRI